jgi:hypothetical protein
MPRIRTLVGTAIIAGAMLAVPTTAFAKDGDVIRTGDCSGRADWKLKVSPENGRWEVEFEVDSNRSPPARSPRTRPAATRSSPGPAT